MLSIVFLGLVAGCILQSAYGNANKSCTKQLFAMDTLMSFTAYGKNCEQAVDAAIKEVKRLDTLLSTGSPDSEISKLNETGVGVVSEDTAVLFERALSVYETTGGLFDVTVYPLMKLWGFPSGEYHVPSGEELAEILPLVDVSLVKFEEVWSGMQVTLGEGQQVDLGGIAKGYTSARIMEIYQEYGVRSGMVSLGGNVQVLNKKPDGSAWRIGIRNPTGNENHTNDSSTVENGGTINNSSGIVAVLEVENRAVVTSGGYERYFEENGNRYIHILNPRTGYPADGELASVTVVSPDGTLADALSTALYIMGLESALNYWMTYGDDFELVLITEAGKIYATPGLENCLKAADGFTMMRGVS